MIREQEAYSAGMLAAVLHELRQADARRLVELASYFRLRGGHGRDLVAAELRRRLLRRQVTYPTLCPSTTATTHLTG